MRDHFISLHVITAGKYDFETGKKVNFHLDSDTGLYMVSSAKVDFGLAKSLVQGKREMLRSLGSDFSGVVIESFPEGMSMTVKVFIKPEPKVRGASLLYGSSSEHKEHICTCIYEHLSQFLANWKGTYRLKYEV